MSFESVYRNHYDFVWRMLRRLGVRERNVEDACQVVFLTAYRRMGEFEGRSSIKTWLCGIALRVASDHRRSACARYERLVEPPLHCSQESYDQLKRLEQREELAKLDSILSQLPAEQLAVLVLSEFEQFSGEEISRLVGAPLGTVRSRLRLARQNFSRILRERRGTTDRVAAGGEP